MAEADKDKKKKKKKSMTAEVGGMKIKVKAKKAGKPKTAKAKGDAHDHGALDALAKFAESPIVADLIAVGATAAVAALAERGLSKTKSDGSAVKNAGKAAAAAIGKRLMDEFKVAKDVASAAKKAAD